MPWGFQLKYKQSSSAESNSGSVQTVEVGSELKALRASQDIPEDPRLEGIDAPVSIKRKAARRKLIELYLPPDKSFKPPEKSWKERAEEKALAAVAEKEAAKAEHDERIARALAWDAIEPQLVLVPEGQPEVSIDVVEPDVQRIADEAERVLQEFQDLGINVDAVA